MSLTGKIQSFINNLNGDAQIKKQQANYVDLDDDDALIIGTSQYGDIGFDKAKLLSDTRCLIVGTSGSGKSYMTRNVIETIYNASFEDDDGNPINDFVIQIHDPEGEYFTLRDQNGDFDFLVLGRGKDVDIEITDQNAMDLALKCLKYKINCIIDYTGIPDQDEKLKISIAWNQMLIDAPKEYRTYLFLFIDEAHKFAQKGNTNPLNLQSKICLKQVAQLGRKRGITSFFITQRVTHLHNDITAECNNFLIGKTNIDVDVRRNGELTQIKSPKQQGIFKTLKKEFVVSGESFCHSDDDVLSSEIIKCTSNSPISKHGKKNVNLNAPLYYEPSIRVKEWIDLLKNDHTKYDTVNHEVKNDDKHDTKYPEINEHAKLTEKNEHAKLMEIKMEPKSHIEKVFDNQYNTVKTMKSITQNLHEMWFHVICNFEMISIKNLYVLTGRDDYNPISSAMDIKLFCKTYHNMFSENGEDIWWNPKTDLDESQKSKTSLPKSEFYVNIWKHKINNMNDEAVFMYLYQDENCQNSIKEISEITHVLEKDIISFVGKYNKCGLVKQIEDCIYLNTIFFDSKIHDGVPAKTQYNEDDELNDIEDLNDFDFDDGDNDD